MCTYQAEFKSVLSVHRQSVFVAFVLEFPTSQYLEMRNSFVSRLPVLYVALLICSAWGFHHHAMFREDGAEDFAELWFDQIVDHFNPNNQSYTFKQRYFVNDLYFRTGGPILLYINGEGPVSGPPSLDTNMAVIIAQKMCGVIVTLEHRYYGKSVPFDQLSTDNLQFLSSKQAIYDLAVFAEFVKMKYAGSKLFTAGGSYSGALSAWFRIKFPHITHGSISSSGVVDAILDFTGFDEQVR